MKTQDRTSPAGDAFSIRPIAAGDLDRITAIDADHMGASRRGYFEKRLTGARPFADESLALGLVYDGDLVGFALVRLEDGEFGRPGSIAVLDAIGVQRHGQGQGGGRRLLEAVIAALRERGVGELATQVDWAQRALLEFLGSAGFGLDGRVVLARPTGELAPEEEPETPAEPPTEIDHSAPGSDDFTALSRDRIPVRSLTEDDLAAIVAIDRRHSGHARDAYYARKLDEVLHRAGVRLSLMAEIDGQPAGFVMARVDYGAFGQTADEAVMEAIGVDPAFAGQGVGRALMSQLMANLGVLRASSLRTETAWNETALIGFLDAMGFAPAQRISLRRPV
ncbi:MAG: hypothetical protein Kow0058_19340 [Roseovarius sp.]